MRSRLRCLETGGPWECGHEESRYRFPIQLAKSIFITVKSVKAVNFLVPIAFESTGLQFYRTLKAEQILAQIICRLVLDLLGRYSSRSLVPNRIRIPKSGLNLILALN
jgi:hypothetical protein